MLLLIDAGNTRIKWALADPQAAPGLWSQSGSLTRAQLAQDAPWTGAVVTRVIVSNVAGPGMRDALAAALPAADSVEWFVAQAAAAGIVSRYRNPGLLGSDRFASAIGAHALFPSQNLVVATCGTATTIDAISADGVFVGGMIAPGLQLMANALAINTAQLPQVLDAADPSELAQLAQLAQLGQPAAHLADHTEAAIVNGCIAAQVGAISYVVQEFSQAGAGGGNVVPLCVLSGGAAKYLLPSLRIPVKLVDNLVLIGLQVYSQC